MVVTPEAELNSHIVEQDRDSIADITIDAI